MKTIIYILIAVMIGSIVYSALPQTSNQVNIYQNEFTLESNGKHMSQAELSKSSKIISNRLEDFGIRLFNIYPVADKSQIRISCKEKKNVLEIIDLLCSKGQLYFSETYSAKEILPKLNENDLIFSLLETGESPDKQNSAKLGECSINNTEKLSQHLGFSGFRAQIPSDAMFAWGKVKHQNPEELFLYTLKIEADKPALLDGKSIAEIELDFIEVNQPAVFIQFNINGTSLWHKMTYNNIDKSIAILMDQQVYYAPVVKSEIEGGNCVITGDFTENELKSFVAIVKYGELPASFSLK